VGWGVVEPVDPPPLFKQALNNRIVRTTGSSCSRPQFMQTSTSHTSVSNLVTRQNHQIQQRRIWTSPSPFLYNQRRCCHEDTDPVREARLFRLRSKYLEPDSSSHQEPSFCPGFSQSSKDICFRKSSRHCNALLVSLLYDTIDDFALEN